MKPSTEFIIAVTDRHGRVRFLKRIEQQDGMTFLDLPKVVTVTKPDDAYILNDQDLKPWNAYIDRTLNTNFNMTFAIVSKEDGDIMKMSDMMK